MTDENKTARDPKQALVDQAQELDMGYGDDPTGRTSRTAPKFEALQRVEAAHLLASASGHNFDDSLLIVAALENDGVFVVREVAVQTALYSAIEEHVRDVLRIMGQYEDADDPRLVGRLASQIIQVLVEGTRRDSRLRLSDAELEKPA